MNPPLPPNPKTLLIPHLHINSTNPLFPYFEAQLKNYCISPLNILVCSRVYFKFNTEK